MRATQKAEGTPFLARLAYLREEMRGYKAKELARCDDLGFLPISGKVPRVSSQQIVGAGRIGAFKKYVVAWIARDLGAAPE